VSGGIDVGILANQDIDEEALVKALMAKNFTEIRKWVVENADRDMAHVFRRIYEALLDRLTPSSVPQAVLTLAEYQYRSSFAADQEINLAACCVALASDCTFKS